MSKEIDELYEYPAHDFDEYLALKGNERIIFSGIFGIGKTSFKSSTLSDLFININIS